MTLIEHMGNDNRGLTIAMYEEFFKGSDIITSIKMLKQKKSMLILNQKISIFSRALKKPPALDLMYKAGGFLTGIKSGFSKLK